MNAQEIRNILERLNAATFDLEAEYEDNGGEITESTEAQERMIAELRTLLEGDGIDSLGRWLKGKEDEKKALKAEKDYLSRRIARIDDTTDYIKGRINEVLAAIGKEKVKGSNGYAFAATTSVTTTTNKERLAELYAGMVADALRAAGVPSYVHASLTASSTEAKACEDVDPELFLTNSRPSVRFTKPKADA